MKIALLGYGKMGKEIEKIAIERNHEIFLKIDTEEDWKNIGDQLKDADVAIEFSMPACVIENIKKSFNAEVPVVVGTTGWNKQLESIKEECLKNNHSLIYGSNFSIGVNIFFEINRKLAQLMNEYEDYNVSAEEIHHITKLDAPSGTAISLANDILKLLKRKDKWVNESAKQKNELEIISKRIENVPGTHIISYVSDVDSIEIRHTAKNRKGLAKGAVLAAEWLKDKKGFFEVKDFLNI